MESSNKYCIINASTGTHWYKRGTERLKRSLIYHGFSGDILTWDKFPCGGYDESNPYNIKAAAFQEAIVKGYTHILWLDCSVWCVKDPTPLFDVINDRGYYLIDNGYNCRQECNDFILNHYRISYDSANDMRMISSGIFAVNINNPEGGDFIKEFISAGQSGLFKGSREHDGQSNDKRFMHHRQDQSAASLIANKLLMTIETMGQSVVTYYEEKMRDNVIFAIRGM
jgi:hypothetical protein